MKKIIAILILFLLMTTMIFTTAKPPEKDKPDNPNKAKGKHKDQEPEQGNWSEWSEYWRMMLIPDNYTGLWGWIGNNSSSGSFTVFLQNDDGFTGIMDNNCTFSGLILNDTNFDGVVNINGLWESFYGTYTFDDNTFSGGWYWRRGSGWFITDG